MERLRLSLQSNKDISFLTFTFSTVTVINCTSLTQMVDPGGPLRMRSCANHFGTQCNFSCAIGYRLNGSSTVTCVAPGNQHPGVWNSTIPTCEGKQEKRKKKLPVVNICRNNDLLITDEKNTNICMLSVKNKEKKMYRK